MTDTKLKHPDSCLVFLRESNTVGIVKWGEKGYYSTNWPAGYTQEDVDAMNIRRGISKEQAEAMIGCSMNASIDGNEEKWEEHFKDILEMVSGKEK